MLVSLCVTLGSENKVMRVYIYGVGVSGMGGYALWFFSLVGGTSQLCVRGFMQGGHG